MLSHRCRLIPCLVVALLLLPFIGIAYAGDLVYLNTPQGQERLLHAHWNNPYFQVSEFVDTQENQSFCGVASMAASLNSLSSVRRPFSADYMPYGYFTQNNLFTEQSSRVKSKPRVSYSGLTLEQMQQFLQTFGVESKVYFGSKLTEDSFRSLLRSSLDNPEQRVIVNFSRKSLKQEGDGHISPVGAYDASTDSVLILDVAKFKYPPFWVTVSDLLAAMQTPDTESGKSRGLLIIDAGSR